MRDIPVGNGNLSVNFDSLYRIRDVYFPHAGQENHTEGMPNRFGVWVNGDFSWVENEEWQRRLGYLPETLVTDVELKNVRLGIEIRCNDTVASQENTFLRRFVIKNLRSETAEIRLFLHHDFRIFENKFGDTAYFDPTTRSIIHYKKDRYFLIGSEPYFKTFATGRKGIPGSEGTWRDAEDGNLQGAPITEGSVDSTIGIHLTLEPGQSEECFYWIAAGKSAKDVTTLDASLRRRGPQKFLDYTANYWRAWVNKNETDLGELDHALIELYKRSLLIIHTQIDSGGAILAANDHDVTERATDHYSYLWTRDGSFVANALDLAGYSHLTRKFFHFCCEIVHQNGYFLQKYNADGTVASGWHPSFDPKSGERLVPIQEDETALVLWALWEHYNFYRDIEFAHRLYSKMVVPCADFMVAFRGQNKLPLASWNLWEDRVGVHTYTAATVAAGLRAASNFAVLFAEYQRASYYEEAASEIINAIGEIMYRPELNRFARSANFKNGGQAEFDDTVDASLFGLYYFGGFSVDDERIRSMMGAIEKHLSISGGIARFENDGYMRSRGDLVGNPWFICTLWLADYKIETARSREDLAEAERLINWAANQALPSGVMAEQIDAATGQPTSVSPLTWSHSTFVATIHKYLKKLRFLTP
ncbi:MAG TPA: glycoside hydrolase family 15 protein [Pyrinomonadaceae bacterium]|nr:glycoside hydrolase family 15 protein [Pyrinomonadaceae bacterium]